jgi:hypothetical protein
MVQLVAHRTLSGVHQTVFGAQTEAPRELTALGFFSESLRYNSPDCPVSQQSNSQLRQRSTALVGETMNNAEVRS